MPEDQMPSDGKRVLIGKYNENDVIVLEAGHRYRLDIAGICTDVNFQNGPVKERGVNGWQNEEKLLELRKRLIEKVKEACYEKNDAAMVALKTNVVNRSLDPYLEIAVLSLIIGYHVSGQVDNLESMICS